MARRAEFGAFGLDGPMPDRDARDRNGPYRGPCRVTVLPPGVCGEDLRATRGEKPAPGQVWRRGDQRVVVTRVELCWISFRELSHGKAERRIKRREFLRHGHREV